MARRGRPAVIAGTLVILLVLVAFVAIIVVRGDDETQDGDAFFDDAPNQSLRTLADQRDFEIGVGANQRRLVNATYRDRLTANFNSITPQSGFKWEVVHPSPGRFNFRIPDLVVSLAERNDMRVRAHTLIWHRQNPAWLDEGDWSRPQLMQIMKQHITAVMQRYRGEVEQWDVVNEVFDPRTNDFRDSIWERVIGREYIELAFRWAHEADPDAKLYYNDFGIERPGPHFFHIYDMVKRLKRDGVPIHGVGLQMHRSLTSPTVGEMQSVMRQFAALGVDVEVTELDIAVPTPADTAVLREQGRAYAATTGACLAVPRCTGITVWGGDDNDSYSALTRQGIGAQTLYAGDGDPKPAYLGVAIALARVAGASNRPPPPLTTPPN